MLVDSPLAALEGLLTWDGDALDTAVVGERLKLPT